VVVADSENNRLVEYQRVDGEWQRTWRWSDARLQWPRDADRLPNGNTLVADSNGDRVFELDRDGNVVWSVDVGFPYEAERLETGQESGGGPAAQQAGIATASAEDDDQERRASGLLSPVYAFLNDVRNGPLVNSVLYLAPVWVGYRELAALGGLVGTVVVWVALEWYWAAWSLSIRSPVELERES
jgi:hypothetical protein